MANTLEIAVTANGIKEALPSGYTAPTLSHNFGQDSIILPNMNFTIASAGNVNADPAVGLANIITALDTAIDTKLGDGAGNLGIDEGTNTVISRATIVQWVRRAYDKVGGESKFVVGGDEHIITVSIEYEITA